MVNAQGSSPVRFHIYSSCSAQEEIKISRKLCSAPAGLFSMGMYSIFQSIKCQGGSPLSKLAQKFHIHKSVLEKNIFTTA